MAINIAELEPEIRKAVRSFWASRKKSGVRSGKTMDGFTKLIQWVVKNNGLPNARVESGNRIARLPGFCRPDKAWDVLVFDGETLIAAMELKSIADSFGKNYNNRNEEALGSGVDLKFAFEEGALHNLTRLFTGYLILVENCSVTNRSVQIQIKYFKAMSEFILDPKNAEKVYVKNKNGTYPPIDGVSYLKRFDILCRRLMQKRLYTAAAVLSTPRTAIKDGDYAEVSNDTGVKAFLVSLASHVQAMSVIGRAK